MANEHDSRWRITLSFWSSKKRAARYNDKPVLKAKRTTKSSGETSTTTTAYTLGGAVILAVAGVAIVFLILWYQRSYGLVSTPNTNAPSPITTTTVTSEPTTTTSTSNTQPTATASKPAPTEAPTTTTTPPTETIPPSTTETAPTSPPATTDITEPADQTKVAITDLLTDEAERDWLDLVSSGGTLDYLAQRVPIIPEIGNWTTSHQLVVHDRQYEWAQRTEVCAADQIAETTFSATDSDSRLIGRLTLADGGPELVGVLVEFLVDGRPSRIKLNGTDQEATELLATIDSSFGFELDVTGSKTFAIRVHGTSTSPCSETSTFLILDAQVVHSE